jgi:hypothetical protein
MQYRRRGRKKQKKIESGMTFNDMALISGFRRMI